MAALVAMIEASPIRASARRLSRAGAPLGYDGTDIEILEWIAAHRRRTNGRLLLH
jgi:hypothetical protein